MPAKYKKRADGRYCTHVRIGTNPDNGAPIRKTVYAKTVRELEVKAAELRRQVGVGSVVQGDSITVGEWAQEWMITYKQGLEDNTISMYENAVNVHILPALGHIKLKDVRPFHIQRLINEMKSRGLTKVVINTVQSLKQIFKKAVENNLLAKSPADVIESPKKKKSKKRALTDEEKSFFANADLDLKMKAFYYVLLYAGLRRGEALAIHWSDICFKENSITVSKTWVHKSNRSKIKPVPKSDASNRTVPMPTILCNALKEHRKFQSHELVFVSAKNELMTEISYRRFWEKIEKQLNISMGGNPNAKKPKTGSPPDGGWVLARDVTPHIFRHTYATMLYYSGVDIKTAQYLLGHSSISMTMEIYTHLDKSRVSETASKLDKFILGSHNVVNRTNGNPSNPVN